MQMWDWKEEAKKDWEEFGNPEWLGGDQASDWISETDARTSLCCTEAQHWLKLQQSSHSILHPPIPRSLLCLPHSLTHCISPADWGISTSTDWDSLDSSARGLCVKSPAIPLPGSFSHGLWCSLCGWEVADVDVRVISWTRGEQETVKETGSLAGSPDWCLFGPGGMGCTTSAVVFDGLRTVLERNCSGYICKEAAEPTGPSEAERALSRRESRVLPTPRILKVCVCLCTLSNPI